MDINLTRMYGDRIFVGYCTFNAFGSILIS